MKEINLAFHSTDKFSWILGVSLSSFIVNNPDSKIIAYIIENGISEDNKNKLKSLQNEKCKIVFIEMPDIPKRFGFPIKTVKNIWLNDSFSRLFLGSLLPTDVEKVLYLDSDTLALENIDEFYDTDIDNYLVAGVKETLGMNYYSLFDLSQKDIYLQGGVILFNLKKWREDHIEDKVVEYMKEHSGYVFFMEQTVVSAVCKGNVKQVDLKYNWTTINTCFSYKQIKKFRKPLNWYSIEEFEKTKNDIAIIHFTNCFYVNNRPWQTYCNHKLKDLFLSYKQNSIFNSYTLYDGKKNSLRRLVFKITPKFIITTLMSYIYNVWRVKKIKKAMLKSSD